MKGALSNVQGIVGRLKDTVHRKHGACIITVKSGRADGS